MRNFIEFLVEKAIGGEPRNHDELLAHYPDPESQMLIKRGIHPGTLDALPVHLRPGYALAPDGPGSTTALSPATPLPQGYRVQKDNPLTGQKDKWGRKIFNHDNHPEYLRRQDDVIKKLRKPVVRPTMPKGAPGYPLQ